MPMVAVGRKYFNYRHKNRYNLSPNQALPPRRPNPHLTMPTETDTPQTSESKCPFNHGAAVNGTGTTNQDWWPNRLKVELLHQHSTKSDPMGESFDYAAEFK